jgi:hypothetical protein
VFVAISKCLIALLREQSVPPEEHKTVYKTKLAHANSLGLKFNRRLQADFYVWFFGFLERVRIGW